MTCPPGSLTRFPNSLGFGASENSYTSLPATSSESLGITFQWSTITAQPTFLDSVTAEIRTNTASPDTLDYRGNRYTLAKIQLTRAAHGTWLIPLSAQADNTVDIVFTFLVNDTPQTPIQPKQIIIVVPILQSEDDTTDPNFLRKLVMPTLTENNVSLPNFDPAATASLSEFFPTGAQTNLHAYYTVCSPGAEPIDPPQDILVIVQTTGLAISQVLMGFVGVQFNNPGNVDIYGPYVPLVGTTLTISNSSTLSQAEFQTRVKYSYNLGRPVIYTPPATTPSVSAAVAAPAGAPAPATTETTVDAYKCVPFDPETQVDENGKIVVDTATGTPYSRVKLARENAKTDAQQTNTSIQNTEEFIKIASTILSAIIGIVIIFIIGFALMSQGISPDQAQSSGVRAYYKLAAIPSAVIFSVGFGIVGFIIGFIVKTSFSG